MVPPRIRVLVVEAHPLVRERIAHALGQDERLEVVAAVVDAYGARDAIVATRPDVMALALQLPRMDGLEFLARLMPQYPLPTVVVDAGGRGEQALEVGAVDVVVRPPVIDDTALESMIAELRPKLVIAAGVGVSHWKLVGVRPGRQTAAGPRPRLRPAETLVAIGASTGGTDATRHVLERLPASAPGVVVVQHMPAEFTKLYAERLNGQILLRCVEAEDGDVVLAGTVYIAPGELELRVQGEPGAYRLRVRPGPKVSGHCPSVDVMFQSVARAAGARAVGVLLTGMGRDGADGLLEMRRAGAATIAQDEATSVVFGMPREAHRIGAVDELLALDAIADAIVDRLAMAA